MWPLAAAGTVLSRWREGALLSGDFGEQYRTYQKAFFGVTGAVGPISIYSPGHFGLLLASLTQVRDGVWMPTHWSLARRAALLYRCARRVASWSYWPKQLAQPQRQLGQALRRHALPGLVIPAVVVPRMPGRPHALVGPVRAEVRRAAACITPPAAAGWVLDHLCVVPCQTVRWCHAINAPRMCREFEATDLLARPCWELTRHARGVGLRKSDEPWRLPRWLAGGDALRMASSACLAVFRRVRAGGRCQAMLRDRLRGLRIEAEPAPAPWASAESRMQAFLSRDPSAAFVKDDKSWALWRAPARTLHAMTLAMIERSAQWRRIDLCKDVIALWMWATGVVGLPPLLRRGHVAELQAPTLWPLVKSKCFTGHGEHVCTTPGHACVRRVCSFARIPWKSGWRILARGLQGIQEHSSFSWECWSMADVAGHVRRGVAAVRPGGGVCSGCHGPAAPLSVHAFDAGQAFEMVSEVLVLLGFREAWRRFAGETAQTAISVGRGRRCWTRPGRTARRRSVALSAAQLEKGLWCSLQQCFAMYGSVAYQQGGAPTGGITSRPALGLALGLLESRAADPGSIFVVRYVDDLLVVDGGWCDECVGKYIRHVYSVCTVARQWWVDPVA